MDLYSTSLVPAIHHPLEELSSSAAPTYVYYHNALGAPPKPNVVRMKAALYWRLLVIRIATG